MLVILAPVTWALLTPGQTQLHTFEVCNVDFETGSNLVPPIRFRGGFDPVLTGFEVLKMAEREKT